MSIKPGPLVAPFEKGKLRGVTFTFPEVGSALPLHQHGENEAHFTFVRRGRLKILRPTGQPERIVERGAWLMFEVGEWHGYEALEAGSKITNVIY